MTDEDNQGLSRPQRRYLRRIFNGRSVPIVAEDKSFLTFKEANAYLLGLTSEARDAVFETMKVQAQLQEEALGKD